MKLVRTLRSLLTIPAAAVIGSFVVLSGGGYFGSLLRSARGIEQRVAAVEVVVRDHESQRPAAGVVVLLIERPTPSEGERVLAKTTTDDSGVARFEAKFRCQVVSKGEKETGFLDLGDRLLRVQAPGYREVAARLGRPPVYVHSLATPGAIRTEVRLRPTTTRTASANRST